MLSIVPNIVGSDPNGETGLIYAVYGNRLGFKCTPTLIAHDASHPPCLLVYSFNLSPIISGFALGYAYYWLIYNHHKLLSRLCESHILKMNIYMEYLEKLFVVLIVLCVSSAVICVPLLAIRSANNDASQLGKTG